jgi:hypothetical protein
VLFEALIRGADEAENLSGETGSTSYPAIGVVVETTTGFLSRSTCCEIAARHICVMASIFFTFPSVVIVSTPARGTGRQRRCDQMSRLEPHHLTTTPACDPHQRAEVFA